MHTGRIILTFIVLILFFPSGNPSGQDLYKNLNEAKTNDEKYKAYLALINYHQFSNADSAIYYCEKAVEEFKANDYSRGEISIRVPYGTILGNTGGNERAIEVYSEGIRLSLENDSFSINPLYNFLGVAYGEMGQYDSALYYIDLSTRVGAAHLEPLRVMRNYYSLGDHQMAVGQYDEAEQSFFHVYQFRDKLDYITNYVNLTYLIKLYGIHKKDYDQYVRYKKELDDLQRQKKRSFPNSAFHYSDPFLDDLSAESREEFLRGALYANHRNGYPVGTATTLIELMEMYSSSGQLEKLRTLAAEFVEDKNAFKQFPFKFQIGILDLYQSALSHKGLFEEAYRIQTHTRMLADSMQSMNDQELLLDFEKKYETARINKELAEQKVKTQTNAGQRNLLILALVSLGILAFVLETLRRSKRINKELQTRQLIFEKDKAVMSSRMQLMRTQMNPHFVFNSLNSIKHFIIQKSKDDSAQYISDFSKLMRMNLQNSTEVLISLDREIAFLKQYLHMEQMRFKEPFEVEWKIDDDIHLESFLFPPMLIQPYVENAIWHGLRYKKGRGKITISIHKLDDERLKCMVEDNGVGRKKSAEIRSSSLPLKKSMGTKITEDRISMTNTTLNCEIQVETEDLYNKLGKGIGTRVSIIIPPIFEPE